MRGSPGGEFSLRPEFPSLSLKDDQVLGLKSSLASGGSLLWLFERERIDSYHKMLILQIKYTMLRWRFEWEPYC